VADSFYSDLYDALKKRCQMVTSPSPGTMRMRFALVDAKIPNATVNTVATYTPYASTAYGLASLAFNNGVGYFAGTATGEGYARDATDGAFALAGRGQARRHHGLGGEYAQYLARCRPRVSGLVRPARHKNARARRLSEMIRQPPAELPSPQSRG
jgi:hypothetical protein